jgi:hypothetical protein
MDAKDSRAPAFSFLLNPASGYNAGMKYSLRSLMVVVLVGPVLLAGAVWFAAWLLRDWGFFHDAYFKL